MDTQTVSSVSSVSVVPEAPKLPRFGQLWDEMWKQFKAHFWVYVGLSAMPVIVQIVLGLIAVAIVGTAASLQDVLAPTRLYHGGGGVMIVIAIIVVVIVQLWSTAAMIYGTTHSDGLTFKGSLRESWRWLGAFLWMSIISGLLALGGTFLLIVPGIILGIWFSFGSYVLLTEGDKGLRALLKSREYVKGNGGKIFGNVFLVGLVIGLVTWIPAILVSIADQSIGSLVQAIIGIVVTPLPVIFISRLYAHSKELKGVPSDEAVQSNWKPVRNIVLGGCAVVVIILILVIAKSV